MVADKTYIKVNSVAEAIACAVQHQDHFSYLAGGTDVLVNKFQGNDQSNCLIDITGIDELKQVTKSDDHLKIGSLTRLDDLKNYTEIMNRFPALLEAAHLVATPILRKTATIGGNILCENRCSFYNQSEWWREAVGYCLKCDGDVCIATGGTKACFSKFVSDTAPVLISMNAMIEIMDSNGSSIIPLEKIYTGDGLKPIDLSTTAIIKSIHLPLTQNYYCVFRKLRVREAVDFTSLTTAVSLGDSGKIRIVIGGVDPKPVLIEGALNDNRDDLILKAMKKCRIVDNDVYSRVYRKEMIGVFLNESFAEIDKKNPTI